MSSMTAVEMPRQEALRKGAKMEPLSPRDLVVRQQLLDDDHWLDGASDATTEPAIPLERFQTLERIIRDSPITVDPYLELARIYLHQNRYADAKRILDLAIEKFPQDEQANFLREEAQINRSLQIHQAAQQAYDTEPSLLTKEPLDRCHVELNVLRESICRARLKRHPDQLELNLPLASALENLGQPSDAIACLENAIHRPDLRAKASLQLGQLYERAGRVPEALSAYRRAAMYRAPSPSDEVKYTAIVCAADLAEESGLIDSAVRYVKMLLEIQPKNAELQKRLAGLDSMEL